ncbi:MAG: hypothetical protein NXI08_17145, partial [bacterium]|nr:hypothetical protein [bacterium]
DLPHVLEYKGLPPPKAGEKVPLFAAWKLDDFRRKVDGVGKCNTTDLRSACEYALKERINEGGHKVHRDAMEHYLLHQHELSLRHYQAGGVETCCRVMWDLTA